MLNWNIYVKELTLAFWTSSVGIYVVADVVCDALPAVEAAKTGSTFFPSTCFVSATVIGDVLASRVWIFPRTSSS
jgi:hypothetical protein